MQQAWEAFTKACPQGYMPEQVEGEWFRRLGEMFPGKQPEQLTPQDWSRFAAEGAKFPARAPADDVPF